MPVQIQVGDVLFDDEASQTGADTDSVGVFTDYMVKNRYEKDRHRYMLPVTDPGPTYHPGGGTAGRSLDACAIVQLARPTLLFIVEWTAMKAGIVPQIPDPDAMGYGYVLLDDHWETAPVGVAADGVTPLYRVEGTYVYAAFQPSDRTWQDVCFPLMPWLSNVFERSILPDRIVDGIAVPVGGSANFPPGGGGMRDRSRPGREVNHVELQ